MEILLVVGIIAILAGIVIVAINPSKQLATVRNTERKSDIKQIDSAILQYYIDNFHYPTTTPGLTEICKTGAGEYGTHSVNCGSLADLSILVPTYITSIPTDPQATSSGVGTGYYFKEDATTHKIGTKALLAELEQDININAASGTPSVAASTLGDGLVAHYKMNDVNCDNVDDTQGNDGTGTCTGNQSGATANTGTSMSFDGTSDYVLVTANSSINLGTGDFSEFMWIKTTSVGSVYISTRVGDPGLFNLNGIGAGKIAFYDGSSWKLSTLPNVNNNQWHHVGITRSGSNYYFWVDGVSGYFSGNSGLVYSGNLYLGAPYSMNGQMAGSIDDVRIYNRVLTADEVALLAAGTEAE